MAVPQLIGYHEKCFAVEDVDAYIAPKKNETSDEFRRLVFIA